MRSSCLAPKSTKIIVLEFSLGENMKEMVWYMDGGEKCVGSTVWFEESVWKCLMEAQK